MMKFLLATLTALSVALPVAAQAQDVPSYAAQPYADDQDIHGRVTGFDGGYNLRVRDERGYIDNVQLHPGTIINPTGMTLAPGMIVSVLGYNGGGYFEANEIDTPYQIENAVPYYAGHPWDYYGPSISLGFFFGNAGWWHGDRFRGGYNYAGSARVYSNVHITDVYRGNPGEFRGRNYVAPVEHGGYYAPQRDRDEHASARGSDAHRGDGARENRHDDDHRHADDRH